MTIHRNKGMLSFECDDCGEVLDTLELEFIEALSALREEGWVAAKLGQRWEHFCPQCKGKDAA